MDQKEINKLRGNYKLRKFIFFSIIILGLFFIAFFFLKNLMISNISIQTHQEDLFVEIPSEMVTNCNIKVYKAKRYLELYDGKKLFARFKIALGQVPISAKKIEGDFKTPEGEYYLCTRLPVSSFHKFTGISYPNISDAANGLKEGLINDKQFKSIEKSQNENKIPLWNTNLGGAVGFHGGGNEADWTFGCIALSNEDMDVLWKYSKLGTKVTIFP